MSIQAKKDSPVNRDTPQLMPLRVFVKGVSLESPSTPHVFKEDWKPIVKLTHRVSESNVGDDIFEIVLKVIVTMKNNKDKILKVEIDQAGMFCIQGLDSDSLGEAKYVYCPNMLFTYARQTIDSLVVNANFPPLMLAPIDFVTPFTEKVQQQGEKQEADKAL